MDIDCIDFSKLARIFKTEFFSGRKFGNEVKVKRDIAANVTRLASSAGFRSCHIGQGHIGIAVKLQTCENRIAVNLLRFGTIHILPLLVVSTHPGRGRGIGQLGEVKVPPARDV